MTTNDKLEDVKKNPANPDDLPDDGKPALVGHIPAASGLFGPHPHSGAPENASGSPEADREREEAERRDGFSSEGESTGA